MQPQPNRQTTRGPARNRTHFRNGHSANACNRNACRGTTLRYSSGLRMPMTERKNRICREIRPLLRGSRPTGDMSRCEICAAAANEARGQVRRNRSALCLTRIHSPREDAQQLVFEARATAHAPPESSPCRACRARYPRPLGPSHCAARSFSRASSPKKLARFQGRRHVFALLVLDDDLDLSLADQIELVAGVALANDLVTRRNSSARHLLGDLGQLARRLL